jgi:hypothetical protein
MKYIFCRAGVALLLIAFLLLPACKPTRFVKPLEKDESALGFNLGGPLIHFAGTVIPVPFSSVYFGHGLSENSSGSVGLHTTALLYENLQLDLAYTQEIVDQDGFMPGVSLTGSSQVILGLRVGAFRFYPALDINLYYEYQGDKQMTYFSFNNWIDPHPNKINQGSEYRLWRPTLGIGHLYRWKNWEFGLEYKFLGANLNNTMTVVDYVNDWEIGAHGIYLQFFKKF